MQMNRILFTVSVVLVGLTSTRAADLSKIDRTIQNEPTYRSKSPKYCLLVFGPEAGTRVWLVQDGNVMHVHDSADGKSPKAWRQVNADNYQPKPVDPSFTIGDVWEADGKTRHTRLRYNQPFTDGEISVQIGNRDLQLAGRDRCGKLVFADRAKDAPIIHFNGPLTMDLYHIQKPLRSTGEWVRLSAVVGTPGSGPGTFAHLDCSAFYDGMPTAEVEYPSREPGGKPIVVRIPLKDG
jgi:hypothetical protein